MWIDERLCRLCLLTSRLHDAGRLGLGNKIPILLKELSTVLGESSRTEAFTRSFDIVKSLSNNPDPYAFYKSELKMIGRRLALIARSYLESRGWDLVEALRISAAANAIDTSVLGYTPLNLEEAIWDKPVLEELIEIPRDREVYVALDNAGEAEIDMVLVEALRVNGYEVKVAVRSNSYEIDVTYNDLEYPEVEVVRTPGNKPPVAYLEGFVIAKGIANLEAQLEYGRARTLHLLRAKCDVLARLLNVPKNSPVIVTGETARKLLGEYTVMLNNHL